MFSDFILEILPDFGKITFSRPLICSPYREILAVSSRKTCAFSWFNVEIFSGVVFSFSMNWAAIFRIFGFFFQSVGLGDLL